MAKIVSFINYKGGVGKTTTTYHIGCSLSYHYGKKVLLVDIDPQTNLTFLCKDYDSWRSFKDNNGTILTLYKYYKDRKGLSVSRCIWQNPIGHDQFTKIKNLDLLPCDLDLLGEDIITPSIATGISPLDRFKNEAKELVRHYLFLQHIFTEIRERYDYILIDCPPNLYAMTQNALIASDYYVITTIPEYLSLIGLRILINKVKEIGARIQQLALIAGKEVKIAELGGIIFVKVRIGGSLITKQHGENMENIKKEFNEKCFDNYTTELIGYSEAAESRLPIWLTSTTNAKKAAKKLEYEKITDEFLRRFP